MVFIVHVDLKFKYFAIKRDESTIPHTNFADRTVIKDFWKLLTN